MTPTPRDRSRRRFLQGGLALAGLGLLSGCATPRGPARPPERVHRIGILGNFPSRQWDAFRDGMGALGYVEGENVTYDERWSDGIRDRFPTLVAELVALSVDVMVVSANPAADAAKRATSTIPIVSPNLTAPVGVGLVASLAHPGGNLTGLSFFGVELDGKRLELLKEVVPGAHRVAALGDSPSMLANPYLGAAAQALRVELNGLLARDPDELDSVLRGLTGGQTDALLVSVSALAQLHRGRVLDAAMQARLPGVYAAEEFVQEGGLLFYGSNQRDLFRRAAGYVDRVLKGANPADLPIEQPTTFDLVINVKTAEALGLSIPQSVLLQATTIVQ